MKKIKFFKNVALGSLVTILAFGNVLPVFAEVKNGWYQENSTWKYYANSEVASTGWIQTENGWYYLNADGSLKTGWLQTADGSWYFLNTNSDSSLGKLLTGWQWIGGYSYYFDTKVGATQGRMYASTTTPDGYIVNKDGRWMHEGAIQYVSGKGMLPEAGGAGNTTTRTSRGSSGSGGSGRISRKTNTTPVATNSESIVATNSDADVIIPNSTQKELDAAREALEAAQEQLAKAKTEVETTKALLAQAQAELELARLQGDTRAIEEALKVAEEAKEKAEEAVREAQKRAENALADKDVAQAKLTALSQIEEALEANQTLINTFTNLSDIQKEQAKEVVEQKAKEAKAAINDATTVTDVKDVEQEGEIAISQVLKDAKALDSTKADMEKLIEKAKEVMETDTYDNASENIKEIFDKAFTEAKRVLESDDSTSADLKNMEYTLTTAIEKLDGKEDTPVTIKSTELVLESDSYYSYPVFKITLEDGIGTSAKSFLSNLTSVKVGDTSLKTATKFSVTTPNYYIVSGNVIYLGKTDSFREGAVLTLESTGYDTIEVKAEQLEAPEFGEKTKYVSKYSWDTNYVSLTLADPTTALSRTFMTDLRAKKASITLNSNTKLTYSSSSLGSGDYYWTAYGTATGTTGLYSKICIPTALLTEGENVIEIELEGYAKATINYTYSND